MTIATNNGVPIIRDGKVVTSCSCCGGWFCYSPTAGACCNGTQCRVVQQCDCDTENGEVWFGVGTTCAGGACLEPNGTGYTCTIKHQCECREDEGEIFLGVGQSCGCGCPAGSSVPAALRIRSTAVEDLLIENSDIAAASRAALNALDFTATLAPGFSLISGRYGYRACLFDHAAGWDAWLFSSEFSCNSGKTIRLALEIGKATESPVEDGGWATVFDFNALAGGANFPVPCISHDEVFSMSFPVLVVPVGVSKHERCNVLSGNARFWWYEALTTPRIGRRNNFDVTLEFTWIAINPLP